MQKQWILYGTTGCHLCDEAAQICAQADLPVELVDICDQPDLLEKYGLLIPVLAPNPPCAPDQLLTWPFTLQNVQDWCQQHL